jgi:hypothetical protein
MAIYEKERADFQQIVAERGKTSVLTRETKTVGVMGEVTGVTTQDYNIKWIQQGLTKKEKEFMGMGESIKGTIKGFFYHSYPEEITGVAGNLIIKTGDIIKDSNNVSWRIEDIPLEPETGGEIIFKKAILKNIDQKE